MFRDERRKLKKNIIVIYDFSWNVLHSRIEHKKINFCFEKRFSFTTNDNLNEKLFTNSRIYYIFCHLSAKKEKIQFSSYIKIFMRNHSIPTKVQNHNFFTVGKLSRRDSSSVDITVMIILKKKKEKTHKIKRTKTSLI